MIPCSKLKSKNISVTPKSSKRLISSLISLTVPVSGFLCSPSDCVDIVENALNPDHVEQLIEELKKELEKMQKNIRAENESYWKMASYQTQMVMRFDNLTALLLNKGILNETDLDDIKNIKEKFDELREKVNQDFLLYLADEGKPV